MAAKVLKPVPVTSAMLYSSTVAEADYPAWSAATSYAAEARVIRSTTHRIYERTVAGASSAAPEDDQINWSDAGPTNRWAMFDESPSSVTSAAGSITVELDLGSAINAIVLVGVVASQAQVWADGVLQKTMAVAAPISPATSGTTLIDGLAIGAAARVKLAVTGTGTVSLGHCGPGMLIDIGRTLPGVSIGIADFSRKDTNDFGVTDIVPRAYSRRLQASVTNQIASFDSITATVESLRATVCWWSLVDGYDCMQVLGIYRDWSIDTKDVGKFTFSITLEGLSRDDVEAMPGMVLSAAGLDLDQALSDMATAIKQASAQIDPLVAQAVANDRDISQLATTVTTLAVKAHANDIILRDAGIAIDPGTGRVTIAAVEQAAERINQVQITLDAQAATITTKASVGYVDQQVAAAVLGGQTAVFDALDIRLTEAEQTIDGLEATVTTKADSTVVNSQGIRLTSAEQDIDGLQGAIVNKVESSVVTGIDQRLSDAEQTLQAQGDMAQQVTELRSMGRQLDMGANELAAALLSGLVSLDGEIQRAAGALAAASESLTTKINGDVEAEAAKRIALAAAVAGQMATVSQQLTALATADSATASSITALAARLNTGGDVATAIATTTTTATTALQHADAAQGTADSAAIAAGLAQGDADAANSALADIASDSLLTPDEKPRVIQDHDVIVAEQSGIDAQAAAFGVTTERSAYNTAVAALIAYLATLTSPVLWSSLAGNTTIVGATFRAKFGDVYAARQVLLNKIAAVAKAVADGAAGAASAAVDQVNYLEARLDAGDFAAVKTTASATATALGQVQAKWGVEVSTMADGERAVAGLTLLAGGDGETKFAVLADKLVAYRPDGSGAPVQMIQLGTVNGATALVVNGNLYADGAIQARSLAVTSLSAITGNVGTLTAGTIRNGSDSVNINLNATGSSILMRGGDWDSVIGGYPIEVHADGVGRFAKRVASGTWTGSARIFTAGDPEYGGGQNGVDIVVDTGYNVPWQSVHTRSFDARHGAMHGLHFAGFQFAAAGNYAYTFNVSITPVRGGAMFTDGAAVNQATNPYGWGVDRMFLRIHIDVSNIAGTSYGAGSYINITSLAWHLLESA